MINITVATQDGRAAQIAVAGDESVENVKALVEVELGVMLLRQQLSFNGRVLANHNTVRAWGRPCVGLPLACSHRRLMRACSRCTPGNAHTTVHTHLAHSSAAPGSRTVICCW